MQKISSFARVRRNIEKMGYYPTAQQDVEIIASHLYAYGALLLDPCCGEGDALKTLKTKLGITAVECLGIEIEENRARQAQAKQAGRIIDEDFNNIEIPAGSFGCVFLNPPYDKRDKLHQPFIEKSTGILALNGILVLLIPGYELSGRTADYLASNYSDVKVYKSTDPTYQQIILFGKKKPLELTSGQAIAEMAEVAQIIEPFLRNSGFYSSSRRSGRDRWSSPEKGDERYEIPGADVELDDLDITINTIDPATLKKMLDAYTDDWDRLVNMIPEETVVRQPLMPLRRGHLALTLASGIMDGLIADPDTGELLLIKGSVKKVTESTDTKEATETQPAKEIRLTRDVVTILMMDKTGTIVNIT